MSDQHEFDELARRKLDERQFHLNEDDWLAAQRLIQADRPASRGLRNTIIASLLLIGAGMWWAWPSEPAADMEMAEVERSGILKTEEEDRHSSEKNVAVAVGTPEQRTPLDDLHHTSSAVKPLDPSVDPQVRMPSPEQVSHTAPKTRVPTAPKPRAQEPTDVNVEYKNKNTTATLGDPRITNAAPPVAQNEDEDDQDLPDPSTSNEPLEVHVNATTDKSSTSTTIDRHEPSIGTVGANLALDSLATGAMPAPDTTALTTYYSIADGAALPTTFTSDTVAIQPTDTLAQDSTATASVPPVPPLVTANSPWEVGILGGALRSSSTYTGGTSELWRDGSRSRWAPTFGAEIMHMGRNFGIGTGLHLATHAEDLDVGSRSITTTSFRDSNYFQSIDTTLLIIVGTTQIGGQTYYITQPFYTTVQVLVNGTATTISTQELVRAMKASNRISYVEIPLLADAHLDQGAWSFGVRGGPTVGLLTSRSGALPSTVSDGSLTNDERTFKSTVFGVTGRAYLRYRFNSGWSVGAEPTYRMHFGNALEGGDIIRRNAGWGGQLSLTYRLR